MQAENKQEVLKFIYNEVVYLTNGYNIYNSLFMKNESISLIQKIDYGIFCFFRESVARDIMRRIFNLVDNKNFRNDENICFDLLKEKFGDELSKITNLFISLKNLSEKIKKYRNKRLSHNDSKFIFGNRNMEFTWEILGEIIKLMQKIIFVAYYNDDRSVIFEIPAVDPELFLNHLRSQIEESRANHE